MDKDEIKKSAELPVRVASAIVMLAVAGTALWLGGWWWNALAVLVGFGVLWEWWGLACRITARPQFRVIWLVAGLAYIGQAVMALIALRHSSLAAAATVLLVVIAVDVGAYFAGRTIGGPKIAPKISPSKTWAGLAGGMVLAALTMIALMPWTDHDFDRSQWLAMAAWPALFGCVAAIVAQAGDFFESWMKRKAGVKDSGRLIPGHGGLFDRTDGLIAVLCCVALVYRLA